MDRSLRFYRTSCSTTSTGNGNDASTTSCGMRTTAISTSAADEQGQRVMTNVTRFLTRRLKLKVNEAKSAVARPETRKFLGFSFSNHKEPKRRIAPKVLLRCKQKIREQTRRTRGISLEQMLEGTCGLLKGLEKILRLLSDTLGAEGSGGMDTPSAAIHALEAVETRQATVREATPTRGS